MSKARLGTVRRRPQMARIPHGLKAKVVRLLGEQPRTKAELASALDAAATQVKHALDRLRAEKAIFLLAGGRRWALEDRFDDCPTCCGRGWIRAATASKRPPPSVSAIGPRTRRHGSVTAVVVDPKVEGARLCPGCSGMGWIESDRSPP
jgi:hypothetical protein